MKDTLSRFFRRAGGSPVVGAALSLKWETSDIGGPHPFYIKKDSIITNLSWIARKPTESEKLRIEQTLAFAAYFYILGFSKKEKGTLFPHIAYLSKYISTALMVSFDPNIKFLMLNTPNGQEDCTINGTFFKPLQEKGLKISLPVTLKKNLLLNVSMEETVASINLSEKATWTYIYSSLCQTFDSAKLDEDLRNIFIIPTENEDSDPDSEIWKNNVLVSLGQEEFTSGQDEERKSQMTNFFSQMKGVWGSHSDGFLDVFEIPDQETSFIDFKDLLSSNIKSNLHTDGDFSWQVKRHGENSSIPLEPRLIGTKFKTLFFCTDTSGSMSREELIDSASETKNFLSSDAKTSFINIQFDTDIQHVAEFTPYDYIELDDIIPNGFKGRGGTDLNKLFFYIEDYIYDNSLSVEDLVVVIHTDLGFAVPVEPSFGEKIVWVSRFEKTMPYGTLVQVRDTTKIHGIY